MAIEHKFLNHDFGNGFATKNAILSTVPYDPEVFILGTYNPVSPNNQFVDFFYGRNWFWTIFANYFIHNATHLIQKRAVTDFTQPTLEEIFRLCKKLKLSFSDLIGQTLHHQNPNYQFVPINKVQFNGNVYSLIDDNGLAALNNIDQVDWNTQNIVKYLIETPSIKTVYFTRKPTGVWQMQWNILTNHPQLQHISFSNIHTPSGMGLAEAGVPISHSLAKRWIVNPAAGIGVLNNAWLELHGVNLTNFLY